jgi:hypothetical protein
VVAEHSSLSSALSIQGARSVRLVAVDTGATVWSKSTHDSALDGGLPEAVADMVTAAARVVLHTEEGSGLDDLVVSSLSWFHVLRLTQDKQAVHLLLDRRVANLSLARRELKALVSPPLPHRANAPQSVTFDVSLGIDAELTQELPRLQGGISVPDWFSQLADERFDADTSTLVRVLVGLRGLA